MEFSTIAGINLLIKGEADNCKLGFVFTSKSQTLKLLSIMKSSPKILNKINKL